jgi:sec-independent protein translocase protein TatC
MVQDEAMSLVEHLTELRKRIIRVALVLLVGLIIGLLCAQPLINYLKSMPPANTISWNVFSPWDAIKIYMNFGLISGLILTLPYSLYETWAFLKPGLREEEQKASLLFVPFAFLLFITGLAFGYFIVFKMAFYFTSSVSKHLQLTETYGISQYFSFMFNIILPLSLLFELPIVVMFLTKLRILNPLIMRKLRRYAYMLLVVVAAVITPPDAMSMILVFVPMIVLYEFSVWLSGIIYRKQLLEDEKWNRAEGA